MASATKLSRSRQPAVPVFCCQGLGTTRHTPHLDRSKHWNGWPWPLPECSTDATRQVSVCVCVCCAQDSWNWPLQEILAISRFIGRSRLSSWSGVPQAASHIPCQGCISQFGLPPKRPWPPIPDDPPTGLQMTFHASVRQIIQIDEIRATGVPFLLGAVSFAAIGWMGLENAKLSSGRLKHR